MTAQTGNWEKGLTQAKAENWEAALEHFQKALGEQEDFVVYHNCGVALFSLGRFQEALAYYDKAILTFPDYYKAHNHRGMALEQLGRLEEALEAYHKALEISPRYSPAWINKSNVHAALGQTSEAARALKQSFYSGSPNLA